MKVSWTCCCLMLLALPCCSYDLGKVSRPDVSSREAAVDGSGDVIRDSALFDNTGPDAALDAAPDAALDAALDAAPPDQATPDTIPPVTPIKKGLCFEDGWCWINPLPQGNTINGVWGQGPSSVFAVGNGGTILRFDGTQWTQMASNTRKHLHAVWASGPSDAWAVGEAGTLMLYDGSTWKAFSSNTTVTLRGVWGSSGTNVFVVGDGGLLLRFPGGKVTTNTTQGLNGVWGSNATDVYVVGSGGTVLHLEGTTWTAEKPKTTVGLRAVWGSGPSQVFAVGNTGTISRRLAGAWQAMPAGSSGADLRAVWGSGPSDVLASGDGGDLLRFDGKTWSADTSKTKADLYAVWTGAGAATLAMGQGGVMLQRQGGAWKELSSAFTRKDLGNIWGSGPSDIYIVGEQGTLLHSDGSAWKVGGTGVTVKLMDIWGSSATNVYVSGEKGIVQHYNGKLWMTMATPKAVATGVVRGLWGFGPTSLYAVGYFTVNNPFTMTYDGKTWTHQKPGGSWGRLFDVWGVDPSSVFIAGDKGTRYFNGKSWQSHYGASHGVWGFSKTQAVAARMGTPSHAPSCLHYLNGKWTIKFNKLDKGINLYNVWGSAPNRMFAVGGSICTPPCDCTVKTCHGVVLSYDGATWSQMKMGTQNWLYGLWGHGSTSVYVAGTKGTVLHRAKY